MIDENVFRFFDCGAAHTKILLSIQLMELHSPLCHQQSTHLYRLFEHTFIYEAPFTDAKDAFTLVSHASVHRHQGILLEIVDIYRTSISLLLARCPLVRSSPVHRRQTLSVQTPVQPPRCIKDQLSCPLSLLNWVPL